MKLRSLLPLTGLSLVLCAGSASAAEWHPGSSIKHAGSAFEVAQTYLTSPALELEGVELAFKSDLPAAGMRTIRYEQRYRGLPVLNASAAVQVAPDGSVSVAVLDVTRGLDVATTPSLDEWDARHAVDLFRGESSPTEGDAALAVFREGRGRLVWSVDVNTHDGGYRYLVDAELGNVFHERALSTHAQGRVYPISSVNTPMTQDVELLDMVVSQPQTLNGWNGNLVVTNYVSGSQMDGYTVEQTLQPNSGADFFYDPPMVATDATDGFAQVGIYYHMTRARDFFATELGVDMSATSWKLNAVANLQENNMPVDNAFFSQQGIAGPFAAPNMIGIGQGTNFDFADDSDVFIHEFVHYASHNAIGYNAGQAHSTSYGLSPWGGSIDEAVSDYYACTMNGDSTLGEASLALIGGARDLTDTSKVCPDDVAGEVHLDGEIIGSFTWSIYEALGKPITDQLVWSAMTLLTADATFGDFYDAILQTATNTLAPADVQTIQTIAEARGLDECGAEIPLRVGEPRNTTMFGMDLIGQFLGGDCAAARNFGVQLHSLFHFEVTPEADDTGLRFTVDMAAQGGTDLNYGIYVRTNQHVDFTTMGFFPVLGEYDYAATEITTPQGELVIDANSTPPFDPNATYHMVIVHQNCPNTIATVNLSEPMGVGGAGGAPGTGGSSSSGPPATPEDTTVESDCGCELPGRSDDSYGGLAAAALLALAFASRRRRFS